MKAAASIDIRSFINERPMAVNQWILVILCFLIVAADGIDVAIMGFVAPSITAEWGMSKAAFGFIMGAAPIGLALGSLIAGSSADWFGRRKVLLGSVFAFGLLTMLTATSSGANEMALLRLLTGLGLGAAMPNSTTLLTEYVPERSRSLLLAVMFTGFNFGSAAIGFIAAWLIPSFGWRAVLVFGGAAPLVLLPFLYFLLPESARFMAVKGYTTEKIRTVLGRVCGADLSRCDRFIPEAAEVRNKLPVAVLFSGRYALTTFTLWVTYFMGLLVIYLTTSWLPSMMRDAGSTIEHAAEVTAMFQLGGTVGAIVVGWAMDKLGKNPVIGASYFLGAVALIALGFGGVQSAMIATVVAAVGFFLSGGQTGLNAFAPGCYPTVARATGVSWMLSFGRLGSILGSSIGGLLIAQHWGFAGIFMALAVPATLAAVAIMINKFGASAGESN